MTTVWRISPVRPLALLVSGLTILAVSACAGPQPERGSFGEPVTLAIGQEVAYAGEPLRITFVEVISDSRCPSGAQCVWQGEAACRLSISFQGAGNTMMVTQPGLTETPARANFADYTIDFCLRPYPQVGQQIKRGNYRLVLTVGKIT
jgi:hypothetical protein